MSLNILYTDESLAEINHYFDRRESLISLKGKFDIDVSSKDIVTRTFKALGGKPTHRRTVS